VVVANTRAAPKNVRLALHADGLPDSGAALGLTIDGGAQVSIPDFVAHLRRTGVSIPTPIVGPLRLTADGGTAGLLLLARTGSEGGGGRYTLFYTGVPGGGASNSAVWLDGLQQTATTRTNLAVVNTGETDASADTFLVEVWNGETGAKAGQTSVTVGARRQHQINALLTQLAPGTSNAYARVTRTSGSNPFVAYAVLNDGASPGERSGDGAWVSAQEAR
jgi:hypothetical protein